MRLEGECKELLMTKRSFTVVTVFFAVLLSLSAEIFDARDAALAPFTSRQLRPLGGNA